MDSNLLSKSPESATIVVYCLICSRTEAMVKWKMKAERDWGESREHGSTAFMCADLENQGSGIGYNTVTFLCSRTPSRYSSWCLYIPEWQDNHTFTWFTRIWQSHHVIHKHCELSTCKYSLYFQFFHQKVNTRSIFIFSGCY